MKSLTLSRAGFVAALAAAAFSLSATPALAARNSEAEAYVQTNATAAIGALSTAGQSVDARQAEFARLLPIFADVPRIANFVLGRYGPQLRANPTLNREWVSTFQEYMIAAYAAQLERFSGNEIRVTDSIERVPGRDVVVRSQVVARGETRPMNVQWRILKSGAGWKVVDVSLLVDGSEIWLAQQQQRDFLAQLDRNGGNVSALIASVRTSTAELRNRARARG